MTLIGWMVSNRYELAEHARKDKGFGFPLLGMMILLPVFAVYSAVGWWRGILDGRNWMMIIVVSALTVLYSPLFWSFSKVIAAAVAARSIKLLTLPEQAVEFFGDLSERHLAKVARTGRRAADRWYLKQLLLSLPPLVLAALQRAVRRSLAR